MGIARRLTSIGSGDMEPFIFTIQTSTSNQEFELPLTAPSGKSPDLFVDWGDGSIDNITNISSTDKLHTYTTTGTYTVEISGACPGFKVNNNPLYRSLYREVVDWGNVQFEEVDFYGCNNLDTIPMDTDNNAIDNEGLNTVKRFDNTFRETSINIIPSGLFDFSINVNSFTNTFYFLTGLQTIPNGLFNNNTEVSIFAGTFNGCTSLTEIPTNLFSTNTKVQNFQSVFRNCRDLTGIPLTLFDNNQNVTTFANSFNMATTANDLIGEAPDLWNRTPEPFGEDCFAFCTGLDNYASIPNSFK